MRGNPLRNLLNRLLWDKRLDPGEYEVVFRSRGAEGDVESVRGTQIVGVFQRGFEVEREGVRVYVPFHRVIMVKNLSTGDVLYSSERA